MTPAGFGGIKQISSPVLRFSGDPSLFNSELDPVAQQHFAK